MHLCCSLPDFGFALNLVGAFLAFQWIDANLSEDSFDPSEYRRELWDLHLLLLLDSYYGSPIPNYISLREYVMEMARGYQNAHLAIRTWLKHYAKPESTVALMDVGIIGHISRLRVVDFAGLVNRDIANLMHQDSGSLNSSAETAQRVAQYVLQQKPGYIVLVHSKDSPDPFVSSFVHDSAIYNSMEFQDAYIYLFTRGQTMDYHLSLYKRRDGLVGSSNNR